MRQDSVSVAEFFSRFPDEVACLKHVQQAKYGQHTPCPHCGKLGRWSHIRGTKKFLHSCKRQVSVMAETPFYKSNISLLAVFYTMLLFANSSNGIRGPFIRKHLGLGVKASHRLLNLIRAQMAYLQEPQLLDGKSTPVIVDEVHLRYFKRRGVSGLQPKILMGFAYKGQVHCGFIENRKRASLEKPILRLVCKGSKVTTDQWVGYQNLSKLGYRHSWVNHSKGEFYRKGVSTADIDSCWASFRRMFRLYHQIGIENAWLYLAEAQFCYNHRSNPKAAFETLISNWPKVNTLRNSEVQKRFDWS